MGIEPDLVDCDTLDACCWWALFEEIDKAGDDTAIALRPHRDGPVSFIAYPADQAQTLPNPLRREAIGDALDSPSDHGRDSSCAAGILCHLDP